MYPVDLGLYDTSFDTNREVEVGLASMSGLTLRADSGSESRGDHKSARGTSQIGPGAPCACSRAVL